MGGLCSKEAKSNNISKPQANGDDQKSNLIHIDMSNSDFKLQEKQVEGKASLTHFCNKKQFFPAPEYPANAEQIILGMGCFWCSENLWMKKKESDGILSTSVGYFGGKTADPTYRAICSGFSDHVEVTKLVYNPAVLPLDKILIDFWEYHDPTKANQQGNDRGRQYHTCIYYFNDKQKEMCEASKEAYAKALGKEVKTDILPAKDQIYYVGEESHQQYDSKPGSRKYCGLAPTGVKHPWRTTGYTPEAGSCPL